MSQSPAPPTPGSTPPHTPSDFEQSSSTCRTSSPTASSNHERVVRPAEEEFKSPRFLRSSVSEPLPSSPTKDSTNRRASPGGTFGDQKRLSHHSANRRCGEEDRVLKPHSHHGHTNIHTGCGRHGDDWLFGGLSLVEVVRKMFWRK